MNRLLIKLAIASIFIFSINTHANSEFKPVVLEKFTKLKLKVYPLLGTQLTFPFLLDDPSLTPTLKIKNTSPNAFEVPTDSKDIAALYSNQNTITIVGKLDEKNQGFEHRGNLFITVGGYHISIDLVTTFNHKEHYSNIVFKLKSDDQDYLINEFVKTKTESLEKEYREKIASSGSLDNGKSSIAKISRKKTKTTKFKELKDLEINGDRLEVYIDKVVSYGDVYHALLFELDNKSNKDFDLTRIEVHSVDNDQEISLMGAMECPEKIKADKTIKCSYVSDKDLMVKAPKLRMGVYTNRGKGEVSW